MDEATYERMLADNAVTRFLLTDLWEIYLLGTPDALDAAEAHSKRHIGNVDEMLTQAGQPGSEFFKQAYLHSLEEFWKPILARALAAKFHGGTAKP